MWLYTFKRLGLSVIIVLTALVALFSVLHLIPGDPVSIALGPRATPELQAIYAEKMHLNEPIYIQFWIFFSNVFQGDLGVDVFSNVPVATTVFEMLPYTFILAIVSLLWSAAIGIPLGCMSALYQNSWIDKLAGIISVGTIAIPSFLVAVWVIIIFAINLQWFPYIGVGEEGNLGDQIMHIILPAFAVGLGWVGYLARIVRSSMLEVLGENYIRSARAFGIPERKVVFTYALKVAILPTITLIGIGFASLLSSAVFAEIVFARPGIGKLIYDMVMTRNFPVVQGAVFVITVLYVLVTLCSDLAVAWIDPRVREKL